MALCKTKARSSGSIGLVTAPSLFTRVVGVLFAVLLLASPLVAQVSVGIRSGVNFANVSSSQFAFGRSSGRTAFTGGAFLTVSGTRSLSLQTELLYSQKGISILGAGGSAVAKVDYIEVPVLLRVRVRDDTKRIRPHVFAGAFFSFEATCSASGTIT